METSLLIRIEIILLCILFIYILYYIWYISLKSSRSLRRALWVWNKKIKKDKKYSVKVEKSDDSSVKEHSKNKKKLTHSDKLKISELLKKVKINISKREFDIAKNLIIEWLTIDKFHTELNLELANIYIEEDEFLKAEYIYKDLILVHSENIMILKKLWYVLSIQEKYDLAIEMYKKAYKESKTDDEILNMLWQLTYYVWDNLWSIKYLKKYLKISPKNIENMQLLASAYEKTQNKNEALEIYKELWYLKPYDTKVSQKIQDLSS